MTRRPLECRPETPTRQAGLKPDKHAGNAAVARWLREVANARVHATTNEVPAERLAVETARLQPLPAPYAGRSPRRNASPPVRKAIVGYQHPLSVYEGLMPEALAMVIACAGQIASHSLQAMQRSSPFG